jgi:ABC-type multidrug transport system fused ATPase/permease subunit
MSSRKRKQAKIHRIPLLGIDARYLHYLEPYGGILFLSFILILVVALLDVVAPWPLKFIVDNVIGGPSSSWTT